MTRQAKTRKLRTGTILTRHGDDSWRSGDYLFVNYEPRIWTIERVDGRPVWEGTPHEAPFTSCRTVNDCDATVRMMERMAEWDRNLQA